MATVSSNVIDEVVLIPRDWRDEQMTPELQPEEGGGVNRKAVDAMAKKLGTGHIDVYLRQITYEVVDGKATRLGCY